MMPWHKIHAREPLDPSHPRPWVFLAGPTARVNDDDRWRLHAIREFDERLMHLSVVGTILIPEDEDFGSFDEKCMNDQVKWEWGALEAADSILFWVPREMETLPGLTTNVEFGMYAASGKVVLGVPPNGEHNGYLVRIANRYGIKVLDELHFSVYHSILLGKRNYGRGYVK